MSALIDLAPIEPSTTSGPIWSTLEADLSTPCRSYDPDLWFAENPHDVAVAQELCGGCALRVACLTGALERREPWGVWGGELFERGEVVARKRRPGRPRKDDHLRRHEAEAALRERLADLELAAVADPLGDDGDSDGSVVDLGVVPAPRDGAAA